MNKRKELISYSIAIGIVNFILTGLIVTIASMASLYPLTWKVFAQSYAIGYIILWILNMKLIRE